MLVWWHKFSAPQKEELRRDGFRGDIPLLLKLSKDLAFRMVADDPRVDESTQIQLLRPELRHRGGRARQLMLCLSKLSRGMRSSDLELRSTQAVMVEMARKLHRTTVLYCALALSPLQTGNASTAALKLPHTHLCLLGKACPAQGLATGQSDPQAQEIDT